MSYEPLGSSSIDYRINLLPSCITNSRTEIFDLSFELRELVALCLNHVLVYIKFLPQDSCWLPEDSGLSYGVDGRERKEELSNLEIWKTTVSQNQV